MMDQEERKVMTKLEWGVIFSLLASAGSIVFTAGVVWQKVQASDVRITALEATNDKNTDRLARIETKLDILLGERRADK
jgi:hypothetical protein